MAERECPHCHSDLTPGTYFRLNLDTDPHADAAVKAYNEAHIAALRQDSAATGDAVR